MKVSLNWLKDYIDLNASKDEIEEMLTAIGLEVEGMEETKTGPDLTGVLVGEVLTCEQHPNADRLKVTTVNVGIENPLNIVCGAPNVAQGQKVLVATIGTILPTEDDSVFKIKKGKIRGQVSEGMICAEDELGIGVNHDGIMVLPDETEIGITAEDYLNFETDVIYDIGLTPNRSDATSHLGVAQDLLAYIKVNLGQALKLRKPDTSNFVAGEGQPIEIEVRDTKACPRYSGILLENIKIQASPEWMQNRLRSIGVRPISNIVDITNYILHELGQPLHAFDADKIAGNKIVVTQLPQDSSFTTLDEKERKLHAEDLMICDGNEQGMCIAGVFGGMQSGVTDSTSRIFLESGHFEASSLRRTSFRHLLRTDAAMVFEKGSDPNVTVYALERAVQLMQEYAEATVASELMDVYPEPITEAEVTLTFEKVRRLIGGTISDDEIRNILSALEMKLKADDGVSFTVAVPTNKADVTRDVDVIEEILRIYGFNQVELPGYIHSAIQVSSGVNSFRVKNDIANLLTGAGFSEMMGLSLVDQSLFESLDDKVTINNTSNVTLNVMRPSMAYTALETVINNQNRQQLNLRLFENGRSFAKNGDDFKETDHLSLTMVGDQLEESWMNDEKRSLSFYDLKAYVEMILTKLGMNSYQVLELSNTDDVFNYGLSYHRGPQVLVDFGVLSDNLKKKYGVKRDVFHAIFNWDIILRFMKKTSISVKEITRFPVVRRDLALVVDTKVKFSEITAIAFKTDKKLLKDVSLFDVYVSKDQLGEGKKSYAVSYSFENLERTLKDKEVNKIMDQLIRKYETQLGAMIRK